MLTRVVVVAVALGGLAAVVSPLPAAARTKHRCPATGTTLSSSRYVRVYERPLGDYGGSFFTCWRATGRRYLIYETYDTSIDVETPQAFWTAGRFVVWKEQSCDRYSGDCAASAHLVDARAARELAEVPEGGCFSALVLLPRGRFAVLGQLNSPNGPPFTEFVSWFDGQASHELDRGSDIAGDSLAYGGGWIYWVRGGQPKGFQVGS